MFERGMQMHIQTITSTIRLTESSVHSNPPQATPLPAPANEKPAVVAEAPARADNEATRTNAERREELDTELAAANRKFASDDREVRFEYDRDASRLIVRLVDTGTREVLRQYPSEEALRAARQVRLDKPLIIGQA
jgi:flagellar protein FlaG